MPRWRRLQRRHRPDRGPGPVAEHGATDDLPNLGRVEQLVLRGDGLTTTSLEILTGDRITVRVEGHWNTTVPAIGSTNPFTSLQYDDDSPDPTEFQSLADRYLDARPGDVLLVREVLLVGPGGAVHGSADVVAIKRHLPDAVLDSLATTDHPIGRLLRDNGVPVARTLRDWGLIPAGRHAARLGTGLVPSSRVPGRTYVMSLLGDGAPLAVLIERFAPHVFHSDMA
jgi:chorismate-pyruvate lyase